MGANAAVLERIWETPHTLYGWISTVDHKEIGKRYLATAVIFLILGGIEAAIMRAQLARPEQALLTPEAYNQIFTMHGVTMIFWYASPILAGFGNYLVPLLIGARDMAYPRLNAFSYWVFLLSGIFLYSSWLLGEAPHGGWFAYVPYTSAQYSPAYNMDFYALALIFLTISTTAGAINFIVSILRLRAPGMAIQRMPLMLWSTLTTSVISVVSLPALSIACVFLFLDRRFNLQFFELSKGGNPLLWQQLFWFFGHPWVYIVFLPATGMISMIIPVFARRPIVGYSYVAAATVLTGVIGFGVWVHHMFAVGMPEVSMSFFSASSMIISIASSVQMFAWIATLWLGRPVLRTPLLFALGFLFLFTIGGFTGVMTAFVPFDRQVTDTYFVVGHLHYVLIGANVFPVFAAFYYWMPKMTGRLMNERLGKISFWLMFIGFNVGFFPMHILGLLGMPRRIFTYPAGIGWDATNLIVSAGAYLFAIGVGVSLLNFLWSSRTGIVAGSNPWNADTLEWGMSSPPPVYATEHIPTVLTRHPLWDEHEEERDPYGTRVLSNGRETLGTSTLDAVPDGVLRMPEDSSWPFVLSLTLAVLFYGLVFKALWLALPGLLACLLCTAAWLWPTAQERAA